MHKSKCFGLIQGSPLDSPFRSTLSQPPQLLVGAVAQVMKTPQKSFHMSNKPSVTPSSVPQSLSIHTPYIHVVILIATAEEMALASECPQWHRGCSSPFPSDLKKKTDRQTERRKRKEKERKSKEGRKGGREGGREEMATMLAYKYN